MGKRVIKTPVAMDERKGRLSLARCRAILGEEYKNLTDQQVDDIRIQMEMMADMAIKSYLTKRSWRK